VVRFCFGTTSSMLLTTNNFTFWIRSEIECLIKSYSSVNVFASTLFCKMTCNLGSCRIFFFYLINISAIGFSLNRRQESLFHKTMSYVTPILLITVIICDYRVACSLCPSRGLTIRALWVPSGSHLLTTLSGSQIWMNTAELLLIGYYPCIGFSRLM
jgi:hypothetical protein